MTDISRITCECPAEDDYKSWLSLLQIKADKQLLSQLGSFLKNYLQDNNLKYYVLGVSGGIDSGFAAALLHHFQIPFMGFSLPILTNTQGEIDRASAICKAYLPKEQKLNWLIDLTPAWEHLSLSFNAVFKKSTPIAEGNLKARVRMTLLYHTAQLYSGCVLSTDQLDELLTGFWTLHGDVGDVSPLQLLPKTVEYKLAEMLCQNLADPAPLQAAIKATPTDGLGISSSDLDQLGVPSYARVEEIFTRYFELMLLKSAQQLSDPQATELNKLRSTGPVTRFEATRFKRRGPSLFVPAV